MRNASQSAGTVGIVAVGRIAQGVRVEICQRIQFRVSLLGFLGNPDGIIPEEVPVGKEF